MDKNISTLRKEVLRFKDDKTVRYPPTLRERVIRYARERIESGESLNGVSREVGVSVVTLRKWLSSRSTSSPVHRLVPVRLVESVEPVEPAGHHQGSVIERSLTFITPNGYRVDGLTIEEVIELVERLG